jgi:hypothetical protein
VPRQRAAFNFEERRTKFSEGTVSKLSNLVDLVNGRFSEKDSKTKRFVQETITRRSQQFEAQSSTSRGNWKTVLEYLPTAQP